MVVPLDALSHSKNLQIVPLAQTLQRGLEWVLFHALKKVLHDKGLSTAVVMKCGSAPNLAGGTEEALESILTAIKNAGYEPGKDVKIGLDCAASEFYKDGVYDYSKFEGPQGKKRTSAEQADYLAELISKYPIDSIEDGMSDNDWDGWKLLTDKIGDKCQLVGDDLFVTNVEFLEKVSNWVVQLYPYHVNQIGTLTETLNAIEMAHRNGYTSVTSHNSGELKMQLLLIFQLQPTLDRSRLVH